MISKVSVKVFSAKFWVWVSVFNPVAVSRVFLIQPCSVSTVICWKKIEEIDDDVGLNLIEV